jgi:hypothetical protein
LPVSVFVGEFAREQLAQHVGDGLSAPERGELDVGALFRGDVDGEPRSEEVGFRFARRQGFPRADPRIRVAGRAAKARLSMRPLIA